MLTHTAGPRVYCLTRLFQNILKICMQDPGQQCLWRQQETISSYTATRESNWPSDGQARSGSKAAAMAWPGQPRPPQTSGLVSSCLVWVAVGLRSEADERDQMAKGHGGSHCKHMKYKMV